MSSWIIDGAQHGLTALATSALLYLLLKQSKRVPTYDAANNLVLKQPPLYIGLGVLLVVIGIALLVGCVLSFQWTRIAFDGHEQIGAGFGLLGALLFLCLGIPLLLASSEIISVSDLGVEMRKMREHRAFLLWQDIQTIRYSPLRYELIISSPQATIRVGRYMVGFNLLVTELSRRFQLTPAQMGIPAA